jgi:hypothetical protein
MSEENMVDELVEELEGAANFMRGMQLDPALPPHVKEALGDKIKDIDKITEEYS